MIPGFSQTISKFVGSKSNSAGMVLIGFGITVLSNDLHNVIGHVYVIAGILIIFLRDAIAKLENKSGGNDGQ